MTKQIHDQQFSIPINLNIPITEAIKRFFEPSETEDEDGQCSHCRATNVKIATIPLNGTCKKYLLFTAREVQRQSSANSKIKAHLIPKTIPFEHIQPLGHESG